jgi:hypothetical protein
MANGDLAKLTAMLNANTPGFTIDSPEVVALLQVG